MVNPQYQAAMYALRSPARTYSASVFVEKSMSMTHKQV